MITKDHELSISAQARLLNISRSTTYYTPRPPSAQDLTLMRQLDELHLKHPTLGSRMLRDQLNRMGYHVGRRHVSTLMKKMGMMNCPMSKDMENDMDEDDMPARRGPENRPDKK